MKSEIGPGVLKPSDLELMNDCHSLTHCVASVNASIGPLLVSISYFTVIVGGVPP